MTRLTRDVVTDLWPLYASGEASADTHALVDAFLAEDPEFARRIRDEASADVLKTGAPLLPADHEKETLLRTQRRRALQSMIVNSLALLASASMTIVYLWKVVPRWAAMFAGLGLSLPAATRLQIVAANWTVRLLPFVLAAATIGFLFRKSLKVPESLKSGTALAIVTAVLLLFVQAGWLALLVESTTALTEALAKARG
jgi:hypothetical protein